MKRTHSMIKGLGEARARCAGEVQRLELLLQRVAADLEKSRGDLESLDRVIRLADKRIDPTTAKAVRPQRAHSKADGKKLTYERCCSSCRTIRRHPGAPRSLPTKSVFG